MQDKILKGVCRHAAVILLEYFLQNAACLLNFLMQNTTIPRKDAPLQSYQTAADILLRPSDREPCVGLMDETQIIHTEQCTHAAQILLQRGATDVECLAEIITLARSRTVEERPNDFPDADFRRIAEDRIAAAERIQKAEEARAIVHVERHSMMWSCNELRSMLQHHFIQPCDVIIHRADGDPQLLREFLVGNEFILWHEQHQLQPSIHAGSSSVTFCKL